MKYLLSIFIFVFLAPTFAFANVALQTWGDGTTLYTTGPDIELCSHASHASFLIGRIGESYNVYYNLELGVGACGTFDINDDSANTSYQAIENNTNATSEFIFVCPSGQELTLDDTFATGCDESVEPPPTSYGTTSTSTEAYLGSVVFGLSIIITLLSVLTVGFIWNNIKNKN